MNLLESQTQPAAEKSRVPDVRAAENRLEVVQKQLVRQVLHGVILFEQVEHAGREQLC